MNDTRDNESASVESEPELPDFSEHDKVQALLAFAITAPAEFCFQAFDTEDCRGPGAAHPGGCPDYYVVSNVRFCLLGVLQVVLLLWILSLALGMRPTRRNLLLTIYFVVIGLAWLFPFLPPWPPK